MVAILIENWDVRCLARLISRSGGVESSVGENEGDLKLFSIHAVDKFMPVQIYAYFPVLSLCQDAIKHHADGLLTVY